jgi:amino acid transporter
VDEPGGGGLAGADYVLNVAVAGTAGVAALTSAFPGLYDERLWLCLAVLVLITGVNLRGIVDSAKAFIAPTAVFVGSILVLISVGLFRSALVSTATAEGHASVPADNATTVPSFRAPRPSGPSTRKPSAGCSV